MSGTPKKPLSTPSESKSITVLRTFGGGPKSTWRNEKKKSDDHNDYEPEPGYHENRGYGNRKNEERYYGKSDDDRMQKKRGYEKRRNYNNDRDTEGFRNRSPDGTMQDYHNDNHHKEPHTHLARNGTVRMSAVRKRKISKLVHEMNTMQEEDIKYFIQALKKRSNKTIGFLRKYVANSDHYNHDPHNNSHHMHEDDDEMNDDAVGRRTSQGFFDNDLMEDATMEYDDDDYDGDHDDDDNGDHDDDDYDDHHDDDGGDHDDDFDEDHDDDFDGDGDHHDDNDDGDGDDGHHDHHDEDESRGRRRRKNPRRRLRNRSSRRHTDDETSTFEDGQQGTESKYEPTEKYENRRQRDKPRRRHRKRKPRKVKKRSNGYDYYTYYYDDDSYLDTY